MKAMTLAAGKGTRVQPITHVIPKPMIPILQKPVMEFLLELLKEHGFTEVMVNVSPAEEIENYFRDGQRFGVEIAYSFEGRIEDGELIGDALGSAGGLKKIQDFQNFFDDTFVVLCGDALIDLDLTEAVRRHREKGALASLVTKRVPKDQVSSYGVVVSDVEGRIQAFQEKPTVDEALSDTINTGIYLFEPEIFKHIPSGESFDIGSDLFPKLVELGAPFYALPMEFEWVDIGKVPDYWQAIRSVLQGDGRQVGIPGKEVRPGVYAGLNVAANWDRIDVQGPVYVGGMTKIEDGATLIGPTMIGPSCHICEGATIDNSIIFDYSRIGAGVQLVEKLVFGRYCVDKNGDHFDLQEAALDWLITDARRADLIEPSPSRKPWLNCLARISHRLQAKSSPFQNLWNRSSALTAITCTPWAIPKYWRTCSAAMVMPSEAGSSAAAKRAIRSSGMQAPGTIRLMNAAFFADLSRNTPASTGSSIGAASSRQKRSSTADPSPFASAAWAPASRLRSKRRVRPDQLGQCGSAAAPAKRSVGPSGRVSFTGSSPRLKALTCFRRRMDSSSCTGRAQG